MAVVISTDMGIVRGARAPSPPGSVIREESNKRSQLIMKLLITDTPEEVLLSMLTRDIL